MDVYDELPDSVKQELNSTYHIKIINPEQPKAEPVLPTSNALLPELPPWSQIDPSFLLALPDNMREQVLRMYSDQNKATNQTTSSSVVEKQVNTIKTKNTLTQIFQSPSSNDIASAPARPEAFILTASQNTLPYDINVLNELPKGKSSELQI